MKFILIALAACALAAQPVSSYKYNVKGDDKSIDITNVTYEYPGIYVLRTTVKLKQVIGDVGMDANITVEAWPLGGDFKKKPVYAVTGVGTEMHTADHEIFVISRGLEETDWWSVYRIETGAHLFDTFVPLATVNINRESLTLRYVGLDVPDDDRKDPRLKGPRVIGVVAYASSEKVIREALITCDDTKQAALFRSYPETTRTLTLGTTVRLAFSPNYPAPASTTTVSIPILRDDLDLAHAQLPAKFHIAAFKR